MRQLRIAALDATDTQRAPGVVGNMARHGPTMGTDYIYELRKADNVVSTGRLNLEEEVEVGDVVHVAGAIARVREVVWNGSEGTWRLVLEAR